MISSHPHPQERDDRFHGQRPEPWGFPPLPPPPDPEGGEGAWVLFFMLLGVALAIILQALL